MSEAADPTDPTFAEQVVHASENFKGGKDYRETILGRITPGDYVTEPGTFVSHSAADERAREKLAPLVINDDTEVAEVARAYHEGRQIIGLDPKPVRAGELALYAILGAFLGYELVAHFTHYRYGRTLSAIIVAGDHSKILALALACRALVIGVGVVVILHLSGWLW